MATIGRSAGLRMGGCLRPDHGRECARATPAVPLCRCTHDVPLYSCWIAFLTSTGTSMNEWAQLPRALQSLTDATTKWLALSGRRGSTTVRARLGHSWVIPLIRVRGGAQV